MKNKNNSYICLNCSTQSSQWMGRCRACGAWNSLEKMDELDSEGKVLKLQKLNNKPTRVDKVEHNKSQRIITGLDELDRVLGGGIVPGSLTLIGGDPGVGKSTLLTNMLGSLHKRSLIGPLLYISGEESTSQVAERIKRLQADSKNLWVMNESELENIIKQMKELRPKVVIIDSIQTTVSKNYAGTAGSQSQIKEVTYEIMNHVKAMGISCFVVGHMTKDGQIAGPKLLEHMVDTVVYFEGDDMGAYRILRTVKNRFGQEQEIGVFEMDKDGLKSASNPGSCFIDCETTATRGRSLSVIIKGARPLFIEIQGLVLENKFGAGKRLTQGLDSSRLCLLLAVMEKYIHTPFTQSDVYVNIVGGLKLEDRGTDLAVVASVLSSLKGIKIHPKTMLIGEVGLTGEIRPTSNCEKRAMEAQRLGDMRIITSVQVAKRLKGKTKQEIIGIQRIEQIEAVLN